MLLKVEVALLKCFGSDPPSGETRVMFKFNELFADNWIGFFRDGKNVSDGCLRRPPSRAVMVNDSESNITNFGFSSTESPSPSDFVLDVGGAGVGSRVEFFRKASSISELNCCSTISRLRSLPKQTDNSVPIKIGVSFGSLKNANGRSQICAHLTSQGIIRSCYPSRTQQHFRSDIRQPYLFKLNFCNVTSMHFRLCPECRMREDMLNSGY